MRVPFLSHISADFEEIRMLFYYFHKNSNQKWHFRKLPVTFFFDDPDVLNLFIWKSEALAFVLLDMFVFPSNRSIHVLNIVCYVHIGLKKVCTMQRDRNFVLVTFPKLSE